VPGTGEEPGGGPTRTPPGAGRTLGTPELEFGVAGGGAGWGSTGGGAAIRGGGPPMPRFPADPMNNGFKSSSVISCVRTMCGVNRITIST
jgi:hypothetical protein